MSFALQIARRVQVLPLISEFLNVQPYCAYNSHDLTMFDESGTSKVAPGMEVYYFSQSITFSSWYCWLTHNFILYSGISNPNLSAT